MATIHINTEVMRNLGRLFIQFSEQISNQLEPQIQHNVAQLESDWVGVSRQHFEQSLSEWRSIANRLNMSGEEIGHHLQETATRFENADNT